MTDRNPFNAAAAPAAASSAASASSSAASAAAATPAPAPASDVLSRMLAPPARQSSSAAFRLSPELLLQRAKAVTPAGWAVTGMVGFVVVTIGYTQWDYSRTTLKTQQAAAAAKEAVKAQRKAEIRAEIEREANATAARR